MCFTSIIFIYFDGSNYLFKSDLQKFIEQFQHLGGVRDRCKPLSVWGENVIKNQEISVQFNTFWSKI